MNVGNPIRICEYVRGALLASEAVRAIIGSRVYAYTTEREMSAPHVVLSGVSVSYGDTKDGSDAESVSVTISANTSDYPQGVDLATAIVDTLLDHYAVSVVSVDCDLNDAANMYIHTISISIQL